MQIEQGHRLPDHLHMMTTIPPKYAVSQFVRFCQRPSAIHLAFGKRKRDRIS
jgi:putative transposase